jgi:hypothetical protein
VHRCGTRTTLSACPAIDVKDSPDPRRPQGRRSVNPGAQTVPPRTASATTSLAPAARIRHRPIPWPIPTEAAGQRALTLQLEDRVTVSKRGLAA